VDCPLEPPDLHPRTMWTPDAPRPFTAAGPQWTSFNVAHGRKTEYPTNWDDQFSFIPLTNTTIYVLFSITPEVLRRKLRMVFSNQYGPIPDAIVMNVGRWSTLGGTFAKNCNEFLENKGLAGRFTIPKYDMDTVSNELIDVMADLDKMIVARGASYRPFVAYREMTWLNDTAHNFLERNYILVVTDLIKAIRTEWLRRPPARVQYIPFFALTTLSCCGYFDYSHPGYDCNSFLSTYVAAYIILHDSASLSR
jgi:hypothetical protein